MKLRIKILLIIIVVLAFLFSGTYLFLLFQGKAIVIKQLEALTHKKVSISYFGLIPPLNLQINNLVIEDLAKIDSVTISPSIIGFLTGHIALNNLKVVKPEITYQRMPPGAVASPAATTSPSSLDAAPKKKPSLRLIFKRINIKNGRIDFIDRNVGQEGIKITVKDINFKLNNLYIFPHSVITDFELKGNIPWKEGKEEGKIETEGWLNLFKKDMQATLKIEGIDGIYLYPYYSTWVDLEKARIEKAKLDFTSQIHALNNNLTADCHLELTDIVRKSRPPEETQEKAERITDAVLGIFRALNQGKIVLNFTIRTKMDKPEFGFSNIKMAFEDKLAQGRKTNGFKVQNILTLPSNIIQGTVKSATDLTKAVITGTVSVGKELKRAVEDTFRKEQ